MVNGTAYNTHVSLAFTFVIELNNNVVGGNDDSNNERIGENQTIREMHLCPHTVAQMRSLTFLSFKSNNKLTTRRSEWWAFNLEF